MELVPAAQRADALSAISLLETAAYIVTGSLFGLVFSYLSECGLLNSLPRDAPADPSARRPTASASPISSSPSTEASRSSPASSYYLYASPGRDA